MSEIPKQQIPHLMAACHAILSHDNEDNGMVAQSVLFDIHKANRQALEADSEPFFSWLEQVNHD